MKFDGVGDVGSMCILKKCLMSFFYKEPFKICVTEVFRIKLCK